MRRTVGTAVADELGVGAASRQLGHKSEAVTARHYVAAPEATPQAAAAVLERFAPKGGSSAT
jgi:integrase